MSKRYGKAHDRNRFKRQVREAFRLIAGQLPLGLQVNVRPRSYAKHASMQDIQKELLALIAEQQELSRERDVCLTGS